MRIGSKEFDTKKHCYIMGILNVTPDSFSDGGKYTDMDAALFHAEEMVRDGADILDVGGESTRPGHIQITADEESARVVPIVEAVKQRFDVPVSIDTYKSRVAEAALAAGADLVNDIWGLKYDEKMAEVIAKSGAACCLMHNREKAEYNDFISDVLDDLRESVKLAKSAGIREDGICLDPGIGFGKTYEMNLEMMKYLSLMYELEYPILLGTSRKSMIGLALDLPADQREEGTLATTVMGVMSGCGFVRVHDVKANYRAIKMTEAILRVHSATEQHSPADCFELPSIRQKRPVDVF
ncbi:dihydropteroate synthase [Mediterraneibacter agrestimuris]|uniref:dihydropteroate synthase n=1 Tax=Mediterraneibacter agrestimuris TaxID=2941333 RepID=UPI00203A47D3|nr:dihydropteroate synthase [Mediterraneibacter agrestimuris]